MFVSQKTTWISLAVLALAIGLLAGRHALAVKPRSEVAGVSEQADPEEAFAEAIQAFDEVWWRRGIVPHKGISTTLWKYYDEGDYDFRRPVGVALLIYSVPENRKILYRPFRFGGNHLLAGRAAARVAIKTIERESEGAK